MATAPAPFRTCAITGATGFLGSRLAHALHARGWRLVILKRSGSDTRRIATLLLAARVHDVDVVPPAEPFAAGDIDCVVHCATNYGRQAGSRAAVVETNLLLPVRLLESAAAHGVPFFVNVDTLLDGAVNSYALAKRQLRDWLGQFTDSIGVVNVALSTFYGTGDDPEKFLPSMIHCILAGERRIALTPGEQRRDFIHVDDVVAAFLTILDDLGRRRLGPPPAGGGSPERYEVGTGQPASVREVMLELARVSGRHDLELDFGALPYRAGEVMRVCADVVPLRRLGWLPRIDLAAGLASTMAEEAALRAAPLSDR